MEKKKFNLSQFLYDNTTAILILAIFAFFSIATKDFLTLGNLTTALSSSSVLMLISLGMTFVVISGGTDLSVAATYGIGGMICVMSYRAGIHPLICFLFAIIAGAIFGYINSILILQVGISVWLTTLGTLFIGESIERIVTNGGSPIYLTRVKGGLFKGIGQGTLVNIVKESGANITIKFSLILALIIAIIAAFILEKTIYGRHLYAAGLQRRASVLAGVKANKVVRIAFITSGALCALGGIIGSSQLVSYIPVNGRYYLLDSIGTVFIGSTMHKRGFANIGGTVIGVIFFSLLTNGLNLLGVHFYAQYIIRGAMILVVLAINSYQRNIWALRPKKELKTAK